MKASEKCISIVKHFEQLNDGDLKEIGLQPKADCSGYFTIGYGHCLIRENGEYCYSIEDVKKYFSEYLTIDELFAEKLLENDLSKFEHQIDSLKLQLTQNQFDALVSFIFNEGLGNLLKSTLLQRIKSGTGDITEAFSRYNKSKGVTLKGLTLRRAAEAKLYLSND